MISSSVTERPVNTNVFRTDSQNAEDPNASV
jgi:hypothetical protein